MKDKEYPVENFATFVFKTPIFSPQKMNEFNFKPAQYCINETFELTKSCIRATSEWLLRSSNWTEWSWIRAEIICVISKLNERAAQVQFEITRIISD